MKTFRDGPIPAVNAFAALVSPWTSWTGPECRRRPPSASHAKVGRQLPIAQRMRRADEVRVRNVNSANSPTKKARAGDPPTLADQPGQAHHDQYRNAEEDESHAQPDPAAEDDLASSSRARRRAGAPTTTPRSGTGGRQPDEREAEHREQHPRADRPGRRLAQEALAPARVEQEDDDRHHGRQQRVDPAGTARSGRPSQQARGEEIARVKAAEVEVARDSASSPRERTLPRPSPRRAPLRLRAAAEPACASQSSPTSTLTCTRSKR